VLDFCLSTRITCAAVFIQRQPVSQHEQIERNITHRRLHAMAKTVQGAV
jgi:hypothetical protein